METSFLAYIRGRMKNLPGGGVHDGVRVGIGDDAAVLDGPDGTQQIVCTDQIVQHVDFELGPTEFGSATPADVGYKAVAINASDVAAMGGRPISMLVTLMLPVGDQRSPADLAAGIYDGIFEIAAQRSIAIIGGDITTHDGPIGVSVTMIGTLEAGRSPWTRRGADVGQSLYVTGPLGGSILGRHLRPSDRGPMVEALRRHADVTAAIDISDGFSLDLDRLLAASGVGTLFDRDALPIHPDAQRLSRSSGTDAFRHAWSDGEDFELIVAVRESQAGAAGRDIDGLVHFGMTTSRRGLWTHEGSDMVRYSPQGYVHGIND